MCDAIVFCLTIKCFNQELRVLFIIKPQGYYGQRSLKLFMVFAMNSLHITFKLVSCWYFTATFWIYLLTLVENEAMLSVSKLKKKMLMDWRSLVWGPQYMTKCAGSPSNVLGATSESHTGRDHSQSCISIALGFFYHQPALSMSSVCFHDLTGWDGSTSQNFIFMSRNSRTQECKICYNNNIKILIAWITPLNIHLHQSRPTCWRDLHQICSQCWMLFTFGIIQDHFLI